MLGSAVLDTAIGAVLIFAVTALLASGVTEFLSNFLQVRAKYLLGGLRSLLEDPAALKKARDEGKDLLQKTGVLATASQSPVGLTEQVLASPSIAGSVEKASRLLTKGDVRFPSYLSSAAFRTALLDTLLPDTVDANSTGLFDELVKALGDKPPSGAPKESRAKRALRSFAEQAQGDIANVETAIEKWYDDQMARASGWYKRYTQWVLVVVGLIAAVLLNIDTLQVAHSLWTDEPLRTAVASAATNGTICQDETDAGAKDSCATQKLESLKASGIPLGWRSDCSPFGGGTKSCLTWDAGAQFSGGTIPLKILGWLLTGLAVSFGAPFWFDALSKLGSLRSTGAKPTDGTGGS